jgi:UrcA family protein
MKTTRIIAVACAAVSVGLLMSSPSIARDDTEAESVRVMFPDLDLGTVSGAKTLFMRLQDAAKQVCGDPFETVDLTDHLDSERCQQGAIENAVVQIHSPLLTTRYDRHYPREAIPDSRVSVRFTGEHGLEMTARRG